MAAGKIREGFATDPLFATNFWNRTPREWPFWHGLMQPIDLQRVVGAGSSKKIPLAAQVTKRARINQPSAATSSEADAKSVRVAMTAASRPLRARIDHHLLRKLLPARHYVDSAFVERLGFALATHA